MEIKRISLVEFKKLVDRGNRRAPYGQNQALLKRAEKEPLQLDFETERKAVSKLTALYVVRRKMNAQVQLVRRGSTIFLGPGEYVPTLRREGSS
jgi:hypothetical protein